MMETKRRWDDKVLKIERHWYQMEKQIYRKDRRELEMVICE